MDEIVKRIVINKENFNTIAKEHWHFLRANGYELYRKLQPYAESGNAHAINAIFDMDSEEWINIGIHKHIVYCDKIKWQSRVESLLYHHPGEIYFYFKNIINTMELKIAALETKVTKLEEENINLRTEMKYIPPGSGFQEAQQEFISAHQQLSKSSI